MQKAKSKHNKNKDLLIFKMKNWKSGDVATFLKVMDLNEGDAGNVHGIGTVL